MTVDPALGGGATSGSWVLVDHEREPGQEAQSSAAAKAPGASPAGPAGAEDGSGKPSPAAKPVARVEVTASALPDESASAPPERPTDDQILQQENQIRAELAARTPLLGNCEPLSALAKEFESGSQIVLQKVKFLESRYLSIRRTRGDGNCFFRSFIFAYMDQIVQTQDLAERNRIVTLMRQWKPRLVAAGVHELVFEDAQDLLIDQFNSLGTPDSMTVSALESNMRDDMVSPMVVMYLRLVTSVYIHEHQEFFAPFILGLCEMDVQQFRNRCVEPMGEESDHLHIVALTDALQVPIRVMYLDQSMGAALAGVATGDAVVNHHDFVPQALADQRGAGVVPRLHLLYKPGHYDILQPRIELNFG